MRFLVIAAQWTYRMVRWEWRHRQWKAVLLAFAALVPTFILCGLGVSSAACLLLDTESLYLTFEAGTWYVSLYLDETSVFLLGILAMLMSVLLILCVIPATYAQQNKRLKRLARDEAIEANHGDTLAEVIRKIQYEPVEYLAAFDQDGKKIGESTLLSTEKVRPTTEMWHYMKTHPGYIKVHNHPESSSAFSAKDFQSAIEGCAGMSIVIAGPMLYTLTLPDGLTPNDAQRAHDYHEKHWADLNLAYVSADSLASLDASAAASIMLCRNIAEQYGMTFTAEPYKKSVYAKPGWSVKNLFKKTKTTEIPTCAKSQVYSKDSLPR